MAIPQNGAMPIGHEVQVKSTTLASRRIVAVDNVHPNLRLDFWAGSETGDPVFAEGAKRMLDLTIRDFIRADGSTVEFLEYHETEDRILRHFTLLGVHDDSCWSRGQAWAIAGFLRGWQEYGETRYRDAAQRLWGYWLGPVGNAAPPWDFRRPRGAARHLRLGHCYRTTCPNGGSKPQFRGPAVHGASCADDRRSGTTHETDGSSCGWVFQPTESVSRTGRSWYGARRIS